MDDFFVKKKKKNLVGLQLAPLIDIFVLIIIFLIKGTVMSGASITPPADLNPAKSKSPEGLEPAGQIYLTRGQIIFPMIDEQIPTDVFLSEFAKVNASQSSDLLQNISNKLKKAIADIPENEKKSGILLNFLADASVDYKTTFELSKFCRQIGFQNILFVAQGEK